MEIKAYVRRDDADWSTYLVPYDDYNWTGRYRIETIDGSTVMYIERRVMFLRVIPTFCEWVSDNSIVFREESVTLLRCEEGVE